LGRFHLDGITPAPRGIPQIEVTFDLDANGVLNVSAKDKATGKEQKIRIESSSGLSEAEIEKMKEDAKRHADEDKQLKEKVEKLNQADSLIFSTKKQVEEHKDKLSDATKEKINTAVAKLEEVHKAENLEEIDAAMEELNKVWAEASQELYAQAAQQQEAGAGAGASADAGEEPKAKGSDAVDAEYEVVDDEDKK
jgi:molecular chaperone DnaK